MKKNLFALLFATIITSYTFGQITLEKTYSSENLQVYTNSTETYYYTVGWNLSTIKIYNSDYSLKKQFTPTIPAGYEMVVRAYDNFFLTKNIFNFDNLLEIVVAFAKYDTNINEYTYKILIYNEDGQIVKKGDKLFEIE